MSGSLLTLTTGENVILLDAWSVHRLGVPFMGTDGTVHWRHMADVVCDENDFAIFVTDETDRRKLFRIWDLFERWQQCERVGRAYRDPDDKRIVRFVPFKRYLTN